ncbi:MAG: SDR family NAD(P)-dependent oxidoreductase [Casimicrobiaceae bacterium]
MHAAIITGVSRGLGEALATELLERGAMVVGVGRTASARHKGERYRHVACDLAHPAVVAAAVLPALRDLALDKPSAVTLINNAAVATPVGLVGRLDAAEIESAIATNIAAPLVMADLFCRAFPGASPKRRIINISSGAAQNAIAGSAPYCMSKAALEMLTRAVVADYPDPSLECITLRPGIFETGMQQYMRSRDPAHFPSVALFRGFKEQGILKDPADVARRIVAKLVLGPVENGRLYAHTDLDG